MDSLLHQIAEGGVDRALALEARHAGEGFGLDRDREMAFTAAVVAGMAVMLRLIVDDGKARGRQGGAQALLDLGGD